MEEEKKEGVKGRIEGGKKMREKIEWVSEFLEEEKKKEEELEGGGVGEEGGEGE